MTTISRSALKRFTNRSRESARLHEVHWTQNESRVALISMAISAVALVITAASTVFTYQQVQQAYSERLTPYKAVIFEAKVQAYGDVISTALERQVFSEAYFSLISKNRRISENEIKDINHSINDNKINFARAFSRASLVMPNKIKDRFELYLKHAENFDDCIIFEFDRNLCDENTANAFFSRGSGEYRYLVSELRRDIASDKASLDGLFDSK